MKHIGRLLVANRGEIAIRVFRAASELGLSTIAIFAEQDKLSLHRFKADEAYSLDPTLGPVPAYLDIDTIIEIALRSKADAIHPGYGLLSENPAFAEACGRAGLIFVGPSPETLRLLGDKISARELAINAGVPVIPASGRLPNDDAAIVAAADAIGYPVMVKASWGGGGRGMRPVHQENDLLDAVRSGRREALAAFGRDEVYLERLITRARHIEVQLLGDEHGNMYHLFERDCSIQRRNQKIIERAPASHLDDATRLNLCRSAIEIGRAAGLTGAGTVEFLLDERFGSFHFIEVNPRVQVEHTVTEAVTGLDIVKAQIRIARGGRLGVVAETGIPLQDDIAIRGHAMQCRITSEDPENNFIPDYGRITAYRGAFGNGIRIDNGTAYSGAIVTRFYDPLLEKITAWAGDEGGATSCMLRALREYRIRGIATNLSFLEKVLQHPDFSSGRYTTRFIDDTPELLTRPVRRDRASKLLRYIADVSVNGHPDVSGRPRPATASRRRPRSMTISQPVHGARQVFKSDGPVGLAKWMRAQTALLVTDTSMRDAHQSLLATRVRTSDIAVAAEMTGALLPGLFSIESWGGATFDVAMRFLQEDPWERAQVVRSNAPQMLTQMLLRGSNAVGYTNYPDNVIQFFVSRAARYIDIFRIFDCFNWVENMRVAIDAVLESGAIAEGAICYTGNILDPGRPKYGLGYYVDLARQLDRAGCHLIAIKDMAGLLRPFAATKLIDALRTETDLPIRLHTHDTSGFAAATLIAAAAAGVDGVDCAIDAMSGTTSQACLGSLVEAMANTERDTLIVGDNVRRVSSVWEDVRSDYVAFESDLRSGASEVYKHEMPGGQFTNLKEQARSLGLGDRWVEVAKAYEDANVALGDIIKVTPSSKVVGDLALIMVSQNLTPDDLADPTVDIAFPASVVEMLRGDLGQPVGGWPEALQRKVLRGAPAISVRPGSLLPDADLDKWRKRGADECGRELSEDELASFMLYPKVFAAYARAEDVFGPVSRLPTNVFFYGMVPGSEIAVEIEPGKSLVIVLQAVGDMDADASVRVFFELNGQPRVVSVKNRLVAAERPSRPTADATDERHIGAPMPGSVVRLNVGPGQAVEAGDVLMVLEAMKMETTITANRSGVVDQVLAKPGEAIDAKDLLIVMR